MLRNERMGFGIYTETAFGTIFFNGGGCGTSRHRACSERQWTCLIEFKTLRRSGHGEHDEYCVCIERASKFWEERDTWVTMYRRWLVERAALAESSLTKIEAESERRVEECGDIRRNAAVPKI
jgi:TPP-dependent pyruvate/acetoin dehydrogenase alpha subunit